MLTMNKLLPKSNFSFLILIRLSNAGLIIVFNAETLVGDLYRRAKTLDCSICLSSGQFRRFGDEQAAILGQSEWLVRYSDFTLSFTGSGKIKIQCRKCNER